MTQKKTLMVIIPDRLTSILSKGEVTQRYYNPGNLFDEVHIMMTNDDKPDLKLIQTMVGDAKLFIHNHPEPSRFFKKTLGWRPWLMKRWAKKAVEVAKKINPQLIRCHGAHLNVFLAAQIKKALGIPYVVSLHINPDENFRKNVKTLKEKIIHRCIQTVEVMGLTLADLVMPVYEPIIPYLKRINISHFQVCYNVVNERFLQSKSGYEISSPVRLVCVGNLNFQKDPINIIKAVASMNDVTLTVIGDGEKREELVRYVNAKRLHEKITFVKGINNDELRDEILSHDLVVLSTQHFEFSKVMIESSLLGMPIITNFLKSKLEVPELKYDNCYFVENSPEGYARGIQEIISNTQLREKVGANARLFALKNCQPVDCEQHYVEIYKKYRIGSV